MPSNDVKITVLKKVKTGEILKEYGASTVEQECPVVKEGVEYLSKGGKIPEGFCGWAWADIQRDVAVLAFGGDFPWIKKKGTMISCCTDGLRPVIFKLERVQFFRQRVPFFPVMELYLSDLQKVPPEEILKEIQAPIKG